MKYYAYGKESVSESVSEYNIKYTTRERQQRNTCLYTTEVLLAKKKK